MIHDHMEGQVFALHDAKLPCRNMLRNDSNGRRNMTVAESKGLKEGSPRAYPVLPLRDIVVFPHMIAPLFVGLIQSLISFSTSQ
jgi:hypothetical protein